MDGGKLENGADAGKRFDFVGVEAAGGAAVDGAAFDGSDEHPGKPGVYAKFGGAGDFGGSVGAADRLADEAELGGGLERGIGGGFQGRSGGDEFAESELALRGRMKDEGVFGAALRYRDVPLGGGGGKKHFASGGAGLAKIGVAAANAATAASELVAVFRVEVSLQDGDARPSATEFFGDDHGERGADALAHFGAGTPDFDGAIVSDFEEGVGSKRRSSLRAGSWEACRKPETQEQTGATGSGRLQKVPTGEM